MEHDFALSIHAYYAGELDTGRRACERLLSSPLPEATEHLVRSNRTWYTPTLDTLVPVLPVRIDVPPAEPGWSTFNPTLIRHAGQLLAIVRSSNYQIVNGQYQMPAADGGQIRTRNQLVRFTGELGVVDCRTITDPDYPRSGYVVTGLEDCRLRHTQTGIGVSATVRDVAPFTDGRCRIAAADLDVDTATLANLRVLDSLATPDDEKNWMPIEGRGGWLYGSHINGHVVTVDDDPTLPGAWQLCRRSPSPVLARGFRGGSQLVRFRDGWLCLIHEVAIVDAGHRAYEHRFVWFDNWLRLARVSPPFTFQVHRAIEFAAGLVAEGDRVIASYGVRDAEAWLAELRADDVWQLLSSPAT
jgi:hypothetical protein